MINQQVAYQYSGLILCEQTRKETRIDFDVHFHSQSNGSNHKLAVDIMEVTASDRIGMNEKLAKKPTSGISPADGCNDTFKEYGDFHGSLGGETRSVSSTLMSCTCAYSTGTDLALLAAHRELTAEEMLLSVLLKVSGRPLVLGALDRRSPRRPPPDDASLAWWKVP